MESTPSKVHPALRWSWFGLLVLAAFGYLVAGLSNRETDVHSPGLPAEKQESLLQSVSAVDAAWKQSIGQSNLECANSADWLTVCRRMSLAMVGSVLSLEEIRELEKYPEAERETVYLNNILDDPRFHEYWGERWTRFLVGTDQGQFILYRRRRFRTWLSTVFAENWSYDRLVRQLITSEGLWTDKPEVNFITATFDSNDGNQADPVRLAARTARCFLGLRIDCLQCHDDFLGNVSLGDIDDPREGLQTDFHQLAAFYTAAKTNGLNGIQTGEVDYKYKYLDEDTETDVQASVPYSPELLPEDGNPRERLAAWVTHKDNRQAARAAVSHIWALMFGKPMTEAVDNLPLDDDPNPIMEALVDDFIANDYDIRQLIRVIAKSNVFRVDSRADFEITARHEALGAVFPLVRLRPEQVAGSIIQTARIKTIDRDSSFFVQLQKFGSIQDFVARYGDMGEDEFSSDSVTITQRLVMLNGNMLDEAVGYNPVMNASAHVNMFAKDDDQAVDTIYLCSLNRLPTAAEKQHFVKRLKEGKRANAIEDVFWILLNSTEFAWNH